MSFHPPPLWSELPAALIRLGGRDLLNAPPYTPYEGTAIGDEVAEPTRRNGVFGVLLALTSEMMENSGGDLTPRSDASIGNAVHQNLHRETRRPYEPSDYSRDTIAHAAIRMVKERNQQLLRTCVR